MIIISVLCWHKLMILHTEYENASAILLLCVKIPLYNYFWRK